MADILFSTRVNIKEQLAPTAKTGTTTLTAAEIKIGLMTSNAGALAIYTTPTGTDLDAAFSNLAVNDSFDFTIINLPGIDVIVLQAGVGVSIVGYDVIDANDSSTNSSPCGTFRFRKTAANTFIAYRIS